MAAPARLTPSDWATVVTLYQRGEKNLRELAEQFGVSVQAIQKGLKARGVTRGSKIDEVLSEVNDSARAERDRRVANANQQVDSYAKYNDILVKMTMKRIIDADKTGSIAAVNADILVLKNAIAIVEKARNENWSILGIEDLLGESAELPDLNVGEYSEEELEAIRDANEVAYTEGLEDDDDVPEGAEDDEV